MSNEFQRSMSNAFEHILNRCSPLGDTTPHVSSPRARPNARGSGGPRERRGGGARACSLPTEAAGLDVEPFVHEVIESLTCFHDSLTSFFEQAAHELNRLFGRGF